MLNTLFITSLALYHRMAIRWLQVWKNFVLLRVLEPAIALYGLGFGLALAFDTVNGVPYLTFVIPGIMSASLMYGTLLDGAYGTITRMNYQGLWHSQLATVISLRQILLVEASFTSLKGALGSVFVLTAGLLFGGISEPWRILWALPFIWLGGVIFTSLGQLISSFAKNYDEIEYVWALLITPMFMFSGVFIPIESFPDSVQLIATLLPLFHIVELTRGLLLNTISANAIIIHTAILCCMFVTTHLLAYRVYKKRIFT